MIVKYTIIVCFTQLIFCCFGHCPDSYRDSRNDNEIIIIDSLENKIDWMNPSSSLLQRERRIVFIFKTSVVLLNYRESRHDNGVARFGSAQRPENMIICIKPERLSAKHHLPDLVYHARFRKKCLKYFFDR